MKTLFATVTSKGQVTVPIQVRRHLGIQEGDQISFVIDGSGAVRVEASRYPTVASLRGVAGSLEEPRSPAEMRRIANEDRLVSKYRRD
jgi:AbrB family looped-hinge helix DNA binding protein